MNKMAIASFAVLILGSSAALAQPYGYGGRYDRYAYEYQQTQRCQNQNKAYDYELYRSGHSEKIFNCINDPATGHPISQAEYMGLYPWTDSRTWVYDPQTDLWTDHTRDNVTQYSRNYNRDYSRDYRYRRYRN
jgi:hypothetical protein